MVKHILKVTVTGDGDETAAENWLQDVLDNLPYGERFSGEVGEPVAKALCGLCGEKVDGLLAHLALDHLIKSPAEYQEAVRKGGKGKAGGV